MDRELNTQVFESTRPSSRTTVQASPELVQQIRDLQLQVREITQNISDLKLSLQQISRLQTQSQERQVGKIGAIEKMFSDFVQEARSKFTQIAGRLSERKVGEDKIEEMIDRHNAVLQNFESRINQLHKLTSEQQFKMLASASVLQEIKRKL